MLAGGPPENREHRTHHQHEKTIQFSLTTQHNNQPQNTKHKTNQLKPTYIYLHNQLLNYNYTHSNLQNPLSQHSFSSFFFLSSPTGGCYNKLATTGPVDSLPPASTLHYFSISSPPHTIRASASPLRLSPNSKKYIYYISFLQTPTWLRPSNSFPNQNQQSQVTIITRPNIHSNIQKNILKSTKSFLFKNRQSFTLILNIVDLVMLTRRIPQARAKSQQIAS